MKDIRDQLIESLTDGDTVEDFLKDKDLTLNKTITTCCAQEAAKWQWAEIMNRYIHLSNPTYPPLPSIIPIYTSTSVPRMWWWLPPRRPKAVPCLQLAMPCHVTHVNESDT